MLFTGIFNVAALNVRSKAGDHQLRAKSAQFKKWPADSGLPQQESSQVAREYVRKQ